jgi:8-oxo-dGTP pyrophosphatase MutT (NUDIX family)
MTSFREFVDTLERRLMDPLPGVAAQLRMAPKPRRGWRAGVVPGDTRPAAALLLVYPVDEQPHVLLTVRASDLPNHRGQVSLPGGGVQDGETIVVAALREAHEEVGVDPSAVRVLGVLSQLHIPVSGFALQTVVGALSERPEFVPSPREVARVLEAPLALLASPDALRLEVWSRQDGDRRVPFFSIDGETVWGATAMVLAEFLEVAGVPPNPWGGEGHLD